MLNYAGNYERKFQNLHVHEMLEHSLRLVKPQMNSNGIVLEKALLATADLVNGNENELQQAVMNLLLNALEAMAPGGRLTISTESDGPSRSGVLLEGSEAGRIQILIADTGSGIEPDKLARVFTPFFTTKPEGTGLGLAITKRIVQEHAGDISVESELNCGTRFCVALPLVDSCAAEQ
jgi:signal transduction histidine kinase